MAAPEVCPQCGATVPDGASACPGCGSDESTGWSDAATACRLNLPDEDFDYERFVREEFTDGTRSGLRPRGVSWLWWIVGIVLILLLLALWL